MPEIVVLVTATVAIAIIVIVIVDLDPCYESKLEICRRGRIVTGIVIAHYQFPTISRERMRIVDKSIGSTGTPSVH